MEIRGTNCEWIWTGDYLEVTTGDLSGSIVINDELTIGIPPNAISMFNNITIAGTKIPSLNDGATTFSVDDFEIKEVEMKTSYEGCNKEIAESLQRGEHIRCNVWDKDREKEYSRTVIAYVVEKRYRYITNDPVDRCIGEYMYAEPLPKKATFVIDAVSMMKGLIERNWFVDDEGCWWSQGHDSIMKPRMWTSCSTSLLRTWLWQDWMLEEREI